MYFHLRKGVVLVEGSCRGLIHDLDNKKIYSVDKQSKEYLSLLTGGMEINTLLKELPGDQRHDFSLYLDMLVHKGLGQYKSAYGTNNSVITKNVVQNVDTVWMELRKACNLHCCHCYLDCNGGKDSNLKLMSLNQWERFLEELGSENLKRVILIGGEPLLYSGIDELMSFIREKFSGVDIILYSNLTLLRDETIECIIKNNVKIVTSLYSWNPGIHDKITDVKGSFQGTVNSVKKLVSKGVKVKANTVVMKYNFTDIKKTSEFIGKLTGTRPKLDLVRNVGKDKQYLIPEGFHDKRGEKKPEVHGISQYEFIRNYSGNSCWQGKINITCDGYVSPCIMGEEFINHSYNVKKDTLDTVLKEYVIPTFWSISKDYIDECRDCEYRYVCKDCRPVCGRSDNMYLKGKGCSYNPYVGK